MYLVAAALDLRLPVKPRCERRFANRGPDLQLGDVDAWIEAVAVTPGTGDDAVRPAELGKVHDVPHDAIKLRILNGLSEKQCKYEKYQAEGVVRSPEPCVVAINAGLVPSAHLELPIPRVVSAVFPFGMPAVRINKETGEIVDS